MFVIKLLLTVSCPVQVICSKMDTYKGIFIHNLEKMFYYFEKFNLIGILRCDNHYDIRFPAA